MLSTRASKNLLWSFAFFGFLLVLGSLLNVAVEKANYGFMPVEVNNCTEYLVLDADHVCSGPSIHLRFLDDRFYFDDSIYSAGDVGIGLGNLGVMGTVFIMTGLTLFSKRKKYDRSLI